VFVPLWTISRGNGRTSRRQQATACHGGSGSP
jgi:hypothetical protein